MSDAMYWANRAEEAEAKVARLEKTLHAWQVGPWNGSTRDLLAQIRTAIDAEEAQ